MDINAAALLPLVQRFIELPALGDKSVVAVSSLGAVRAIPNYTAVGASKAALESMVRHLAAELAPRGVRVNAVSSGTVDTDALKHFPNRDELLDESARRTPAGRLVTPQDIANTVVFLCTDFASMIHGQIVLVVTADTRFAREAQPPPSQGRGKREAKDDRITLPSDPGGGWGLPSPLFQGAIA